MYGRLHIPQTYSTFANHSKFYINAVPELLLHYIWQMKAFLAYPQETTDHRRIEVIDVGMHNTDAGPDFFNVKLRIDGQLWVGNIEIHILSSDWYHHHHEKDPAYDNIILHVVKRADREVFNSKGERIPQCELRYPNDEKQLERLLIDRLSVCNTKIAEQPSLVAETWKQTLLNRRLLKKTEAIHTLLQQSHNDWEEALYITLAHNFGFHTNGLPFEMVARQTPLAYLRKHRDNLFQLEAIILGQSGIVRDGRIISSMSMSSDYLRRLQAEYRFLQKKFSLTPIDPTMWKMGRMRPQNSPIVRLRQFAAIMQQSEGLFARLMQTSDIHDLRTCFTTISNDPQAVPAVGKASIDILLINTVVPYKFAYGKAHNNLRLQDEAFAILNALPAEKNHILDQWKLLGLKAHNAADSQSLIHLYQDYCIIHRCFQCDVGYQIFTQPQGLS